MSSMPDPPSLAWVGRPRPASSRWIGRIADPGGRRQRREPLGQRPADARVQESSPDALMLDVVRDRDRDLGDVTAGRLEAQVTDDALGPASAVRAGPRRSPRRDRGRACRTRSTARGSAVPHREEPRPPALAREARVERSRAAVSDVGCAESASLCRSVAACVRDHASTVARWAWADSVARPCPQDLQPLAGQGGARGWSTAGARCSRMVQRATTTVAFAWAATCSETLPMSSRSTALRSRVPMTIVS